MAAYCQFIDCSLEWIYSRMKIIVHNGTVVSWTVSFNLAKLVIQRTTHELIRTKQSASCRAGKSNLGVYYMS